MPFKKQTLPPPLPPAALAISDLTLRAQLLISRGRIIKRLLPEGDIVIFCLKVSLPYLFCRVLVTAQKDFCCQVWKQRIRFGRVAAGQSPCNPCR